jgi:hypothetical protein
LTEYQVEKVILPNCFLEKDPPALVDWIEYLLTGLEVFIKALLHSGCAKKASRVIRPL